MVATDLDPRFTFETFVVGPANRLAAAAARRVADAPGTSYNPLFIYSSSGLGKSHILNGIAHHAAKAHPGFSVVYVTVESFLNELTAAVQAGSEGELRERYQELHILLLDDVQFFTGQNEAQEMLLRLLDGMSKSGGQVVLASDRPPADINGLDKRLLTRFSGGLIVDIAAPEYETKVAILRKKAEERGQTFEVGVAEALAKHAFKSVRELAGALNKVLAIQELEGRQVAEDEIEALAGLQEPEPSEAPVAGEQLLDEFGSFMGGEEEPWRRLLREAAETFEKDGYSGTRLRRVLESTSPPPDPQQVVDQFRRDVAQLREVEKALNQAGNPWPEAAVGLLKDPERLDEAASLLASALERVKPFARLGEGPSLTALRSSYDAVVVKAAAKLITDERPEYNPLYLWSKTREGPLALAAATARSFREAQKMSNIAIVSAAEFAEDYIRALEGGVAGAWRERWWDVDLLVVYDAEKISATERAKDEFFHLFEASKRRGTKIMIAADRAPSGIDDIDERLRSRFEMGLVVEAPGRGLPAGAGDMNLEEAPPEYIQDDDLWGGFMRPKVADTVLPPVEEVEAGDGVGPAVDEPAPAPAEELAQQTETAEAADAAEAAAPGSAWRPSKENVVWDWQAVEERIVEMTE